MEGLIVKALSGFYYVLCDGQITECRARGVFRNNNVTPLVGDLVTFENRTVTDVLPRLNAFERPPVANVEVMVLVTAAKNPDPSLDVLDKMTVAAEAAHAKVILCVSKADLAEESLRQKFVKTYGATYPIVFTSVKTGEGLDALRQALAGCKAALCGPSGSGKSSLNNALLGPDLAQTGEISEKTGRGKNTTRHTEIFSGENLLVFDTPGFTSFDAPQMPSSEVQHLFPEMKDFLGKCQFTDCAHLKEPGCAVTDAVRAGFISRSRYRSYRDMLIAAKQREEYYG